MNYFSKRNLLRGPGFIKLLRVLLLTAVSVHYSLGQNVLIKQNGETIPCRKIKFEGGYALIVGEDKEKRKINEDEVLGYYQGSSEKILYKKKIIADNSNEKPLVIFAHSRDTAGFEYLEREEAGRINLYVREEHTGGPGHMGPNGTMTASTATSTYYYYAEKDGIYKNVYITGLFRDKSEDYKALKSFVMDDPEILETLRSDDFRLNEKNLLRLIQQYNVKYFQKIEASKYKTKANTSFYTKALPKIKDNLTITVNDSLQLKMPHSAWPLPVSLPGNVPSKVCITYDGKSSCRIIGPTPFAASYYEMDYSSNEKSFDIEKRTVNQFKSYVSYYVKK